MNNSFLKLILIGDGRVGKTSIINKYIHNKFNENEGMTLNCCYMEKTIIHNDRKYKFSIWDTAGQEKFNAITPIYYRDARGVILVYDITNPHSFERVKKWIEELKNYNENASIVIVGNKIDLKDNIAVNSEMSQEKAKSLNMAVMETSALDSSNVQEAFFQLLKEMYKSVKALVSNQGTSQEKLGEAGVQLNTNTANQEKKKKCC